MIKKIITSNLTNRINICVCKFSSGKIQAQPQAPTNLTSGAITASSVVLNWTAAGGGTENYQ